MTLPQHDRYSQPSPAPQGAWEDPGPVAPGGDLGADLGAALSFTGNALLRNPVTYLISGLVFCVIYLVIGGGGLVGGFFALFAVMGGPSASDTEGFAGMLAFYGVFLVAMLLTVPFGLLWQSGAARAAGIVREGGRPSIGQAMVGSKRVILTALLYGLVVIVGMLLLYIPGLIAGVLFMFAIPAAVRGASPMEAMKESLALSKANLGTTIVSYLVIMVITSIASMIILPILVLTPFIMLFELGMYERLSGRRLPEPARA